MANLSRTSKIILSIFISVSILCALFYNIKLDAFIDASKNLLYHYLLFVVLAQMISFILRAERFKLIINYKYRLELFSISAIHNFLNKILPLRTGEISIPLLFKKYTALPISYGIGALLFFRFLDILAILTLFLFSSFFVSVDMNLTYFKAASLFLIILQLFILIRIDVASNMFRKLLYKVHLLKLQTMKQKLIDKLTELEEYVTDYNSNLLLLISLSLLNWIVTYSIYYFICFAFRLDYNFAEVIFGATFVTIISNFSINSVGRFGIFEAGWAAGFMLIGLETDFAIPMGLFINIFITIVNGIFALFGFYYLSVTTKKNLTYLKLNSLNKETKD